MVKSILSSWVSLQTITNAVKSTVGVFRSRFVRTPAEDVANIRFSGITASLSNQSVNSRSTSDSKSNLKIQTATEGVPYLREGIYLECQSNK